MNGRISAALFTLLILIVCITAIPGIARAEGYSYIAPDALKTKVESGTPMTVVDIQVKEEFDKHHIKGVVATYAYPVKFPADRANLEPVYEQIVSNSDPVIIVCPRGGGGAKRTWDYLAGRGISEDRLFILKGGQAGWPYGELLEGSNK